MEYQHVKMRSVSDALFNLPVNFQPLEEFKQGTTSEPKQGL